jgi:DNA (cytosine-5)-methyltransferase 1
MNTVGLFAGIGGIETGLHLAGFHTDLLCEINPAARRVLERQVRISANVNTQIASS